MSDTTETSISKFCTFCEMPLPPGCRHLSGEYKECPLGKRTDLPWVVGMEIWKDLTDRRGVKNELNACEDSVKAEIIETIGRIAVMVMNKCTARKMKKQ